jgi:hypothetical protein
MLHAGDSGRIYIRRQRFDYASRDAPDQHGAPHVSHANSQTLGA